MIIPVLMYHQMIGNHKSPNRYMITIQEFERQMKYIKNNGYQPIGIEDFEMRLNRFVNPVMITFDDGFETDLTIALPIMQKYGFKSTHFIVTDYIGTKGYMNWEQVQVLKERGMSIHSHTKSHRLLDWLDEAEAKEELSLSKSIIEKKMGNQVIALSLPRGCGSSKMKGLLKECRYRYLFTSWPDINNFSEKNAEIFEVGRVFISGNMNLENFKKALRGDKTFYRKNQVYFLVKKLLKKIITPDVFREIFIKEKSQ